ncbi:hypothetical protein ACGFNU_23225 [Spirillospora sp. NPDC048911]|uniref:hypothetical protein n=1 Tax=Spirillospora sp. NPDC048911 TaxID=3364527 RepID=UPI00371F6354
MRRFAAVALSAGTLMAGMAAISSPAQATDVVLADSAASTAAASAPSASAAARAWKPINSYPKINAWGTYSRNSSRVTVTGKLQDTDQNGWTACVRFLFTETVGRKTYKYYSRHHIVAVRSNGTRYAYDGPGTITIRTSSSYTGHAWVQECGRSKKTGKFLYGKGKKLY